MVISYAFCEPKKKTNFNTRKKTLYIDQITVNKEFRKQEIGKMLMNEALDLAKKLKVAEIRLDNWIKNEEANGFFKSLGFEYYNSKMKILI
ncbi:MAG: GNAT family N-acetyltransferase [Polaribacter sp.]